MGVMTRSDLSDFSHVLLLLNQQRQSGLKSGGSWIQLKKDFDFSWQISEKCRFFQAI